MKIANVIGLILLFGGLSACHTMPVRLDNIALMWKPTSDIKLPPETLKNIIDTKIEFGVFKDVRNNPALIAQNREGPTPKPVTTRDNVGEYVSTYLRTAFGRVGLTTVDKDGDVVISGEVKQFFVDETNTYKGHVLLKVNVRNHGGKTLWTGVASGASSRFGRSYSAENYYETFSDSILDAASSLLQDPEFRAALAQRT